MSERSLQASEKQKRTQEMWSRVLRLGARSVRVGWLGITRHSHLRALLVVYLAITIFIVGCTFLWWTTRDTFRPGFMPSLSRNEVLVLATLLAVPVLIASVWDRL